MLLACPAAYLCTREAHGPRLISLTMAKCMHTLRPYDAENPRSDWVCGVCENKEPLKLMWECIYCKLKHCNACKEAY